MEQFFLQYSSKWLVLCYRSTHKKNKSAESERLFAHLLVLLLVFVRVWVRINISLGLEFGLGLELGAKSNPF